MSNDKGFTKPVEFHVQNLQKREHLFRTTPSVNYWFNSLKYEINKIIVQSTFLVLNDNIKL